MYDFYLQFIHFTKKCYFFKCLLQIVIQSTVKNTNHCIFQLIKFTIFSIFTFIYALTYRSISVTRKHLCEIVNTISSPRRKSPSCSIWKFRGLRAVHTFAWREGSQWALCCWRPVLSCLCGLSNLPNPPQRIWQTAHLAVYRCDHSGQSCPANLVKITHTYELNIVGPVL